MSGWNVRVLKLRPVLERFQTQPVLLPSIHLRVVIPRPSAQLEESDLCVLRVSFDSRRVDRVELFAIDKARSLENGDTLESEAMLVSARPRAACHCLPQLIMNLSGPLDVVFASYAEALSNGDGILECLSSTVAGSGEEGVRCIS